jgi:aspartate kinase
MKIVVQKYGGSSVADLSRIQRVAARIKATRKQGYGVVVAVSAMGNTTNELISLAHQVTKAPDRRELDMLVSVGERISMALLAMALGELGVPARSLTGSQSGIITDEAHADATVVEVRPDRVRRHLAAGDVVIVAGFQGVSREREVTTLGRGGTDTTAVVLAAALGAEYCEICSDVDGVWSADPRVVPDAIKLDEMSLNEALTLARGGAKVLFEDAVRYARDQGVQIVASSTFGPGSGTRLTTTPKTHRGAIAVTGDNQLVEAPAARARAIRLGGGRIRRRIGETIIVDTRNAHGGVSGNPVAMVTAAGSGLAERLDEADDAHNAITSAGIQVSATGSEGDAIWWIVAPIRLDDTVRLVHKKLCEPNQ